MTLVNPPPPPLATALVMTSSKSRKTAKNQKNHDFIDFSQLWASLSQV